MRAIVDLDPPELPAWLVHVPEMDNTNTPIMVFTSIPPDPGDKLHLRFPWQPEYVVLTAVSLLPVRRIPRNTVLVTWMGAAWADALFLEFQETAPT